MAATRRLFKNAAAMLGLGIAQRALGLVAIFLLARILDVRGLGAYAFTQSTSQTFFGLVRVGADAGLHVSVAGLRLPEERRDAEKLLGESLVLFLTIAAVSSVVLVLLAHPISAILFAAPQLSPFVAASAVLLAAQVVNQFSYTVFAGLSAFTVYAQLTWVTTSLSLVLAVGGAVWFGAVGAIWGAAAGAAASAVALTSWLLRELARRGIAPRLQVPSRKTFSMLALGFPFYVSGLLLIPADFLCIGYLGRVEGIGALGELRVVQSLMGVATVLPTAISGPLISHLASRIFANGGADAVLIQLRTVWVLSLTITIGLATLWPILVATVFGMEFVAAKSAGIAALLGFTPMMLVSVLTGAFLASRRTGMLVLVSVLQLIGIAMAAIPLIGNYGLGGYLAVQATYMGIGAMAALALLSRQFQEAFLRSWMLPLAALTIAVSAIIVADIALTVSLEARLAVGVAAIVVLGLTCAKLVLTPEEFERIVKSLNPAWRQTVSPGKPNSADPRE